MSRQTNYRTVQTPAPTPPPSVLSMSDLAAYRCHRLCYVLERLTGGASVRADRFIEGDADRINHDHEAIHCIAGMLAEMIPQP